MPTVNFKPTENQRAAPTKSTSSVQMQMHACIELYRYKKIYIGINKKLRLFKYLPFIHTFEHAEQQKKNGSLLDICNKRKCRIVCIIYGLFTLARVGRNSFH